MSRRKVLKLLWQIRKRKILIRDLEARMDRAKELLENGEITRAEYTKIKMDLAAKIRGVQASIKRKRLARMRIEKKMKERREERERKQAERARKKAEKRAAKEKKRKAKASATKP